MINIDRLFLKVKDTFFARAQHCSLIFLSNLSILCGDFFMTKVPDPKAEKVVATNRKARHEYAVLDSLEAGIALTGTEVKSIRMGNLNLTDGYAVVKRGEVWLLGMHVSPYEQGSYANVDPRRDRKLLLHKKEIRRLLSRMGEPGVTLIPLQVYFKNRVAKVLLGVCRGKRAYDKREDISRREVERDIRRQYAR
jgi:SsrA-binding protein